MENNSKKYNHPGGNLIGFYLEHEEELSALFEKYAEEGRHLPGNTFEDVSGPNAWLEKLRRGEEE